MGYTITVPDQLKLFSDLYLLALCVYREARGEPIEAKTGVACVVRNRVNHPGWWGKDYSSVILHHWQFSSFNPNDPNAQIFPASTEQAWADSVTTAYGVMSFSVPDNTYGSTLYFDKSLDKTPPSWAALSTPTVDLGRLHFYKQPA